MLLNNWPTAWLRAGINVVRGGEGERAGVVASGSSARPGFSWTYLVRINSRETTVLPRLAVSPPAMVSSCQQTRSPSSLLTSWPATHPQADVRFVLLETAMGYLLFERKESDEIGATLPEVQAAVKDYGKFSLVLKLKAQFFFRTAEEALANINDISEGIVTPSLKVHRNQLTLGTPHGM